ncbi:RAVE protein 1 C terminal-domain-containing protein [Mariannaea sp. PMI_226]|nr:RAVE protein 1 C terminal-domain-containing protein [Mariannaea sp. PMI_226]
MSIDRFSDADHLVSHMQPHASRSSSPSYHGDDSSDASPAPSSNDPYYSNDDIAALHSVVVAAQEILDHAPEPKPLPAAALFKAYDVVLPNYGIDPDDDHHLSTFVFRIGGERGGRNLIDKFQAILSRMGIVLEFGDNSTGSSRPSNAASPSHLSSKQVPTNDRHALDDDTLPNDDRRGQRPLSTRIAQLMDEDVDDEGHEGDEDESEREDGEEEREGQEENAEDEEEELRVRARRAALSFALDRLRSQSILQKGLPHLAKDISSSMPQEVVFSEVHPVPNSIDRPRRGQTLPNITEEVTEEERETMAHRLEGKDEASSINMDQDSLQSLLDAPRSTVATSQNLPVETNGGDAKPVDPKMSRTSHLEGKPPGHSDEDITEKVSLVASRENLLPPVGTVDREVEDKKEDNLTMPPSVTTPKQQTGHTPPQTPPLCPKEPNTAELEARHHKSLRQATRARELYLASKVFNHWADRTARRLEREAVARRHMIRFRYFSLWSQAPALREPIIEQMKTSVAARKWQRLTARENDLEQISRAASDAYRRKKIGLVLDQWNYHRLQHVGQEMTAFRTRARALANWTCWASKFQTLAEAIESHSKERLGRDAIAKWQSYTDADMSRYVAARRLGTAHRTFYHLREWWDQAELGRCAAAYRRHLLLKKISFAFDQWNLMARAQAFLWRREYISVVQACGKWCRNGAEKQEMQRTAKLHYEIRAKSEAFRRIRHHQQDISALVHLEGRALLYLRGIHLLEVFEQTVRRRKDRDKEAVKRHLMARYTQVSSARRKRNFFVALEKWRIFTAQQDQGPAREAYELKTRAENQQRLAILDFWGEVANIDQTRSREAQFQHIYGVLDVWKAYAMDLGHRDLEAWQLWASERQRNCLKEWSIASLQQSGQAHTASEVCKKHDREKRNRYLQSWRHLGERINPDASGIESPRVFTALSQGQGSHRISWRALSGRRSVVRRNDRMQDFTLNVVETPTRWTGQPSLMSSIMPGSSMAPVSEENEDATSSTAGDDAVMTNSPSRKVLGRKVDRFFTLSSTTPKAPVPLYLEQDFHDSHDEQDSRMTPIPTHAELAESQSGERPVPFLRPSAPAKAFGYRSTDINKSLESQPHSQLNPRPAVNKSFSARPSALRYGVIQSPGLTPSTRSVRIQSPKSRSALIELFIFHFNPFGDARSVIFGSMKAVLPGKPQSRLQGLATGYWEARHINAYISGSAFAILEGSHTVLQTIYDDDPCPLEAISFDEASGKIATCTSTQVRVYQPFGSREDDLKWALGSTFEIPRPNPELACTLSWGSSEELLVATKSLFLYDTKAEPKCLWQKKLPSAVQYALLAHDSAYIATVGQHDRLVKVWRRLTYGSDEVRFDLTYLRHPNVVTSIRWRKPFHLEQAVDNVLYTISLDKCLRIWTPTDTLDGKHWQLWGQVDMCAPSQDYPLPQDMRWAFVIDGRDFTASVEKEVELRMSDDSSTDDVALDHLVAIANKNPEVCIALDGQGAMSAWAFENVTSASAGKPVIFRVARVQCQHFKFVGKFIETGDVPHTQIQTYCDRKTGKIHMLLHCFDGRIGVFTGSVADILDPTTNDRRLSLHTVWSGHSSSITKIVRNFSGRAVVSRTRNGESMVWKHVLSRHENPGLSLTCASTIPETGHIHRICVLRKGRFVVFLRHGSISLWDCRHRQARSLARCDFQIAGKPLCLIILPRRQVKEYTIAHIATVTSEQRGIVWEVKLPRYIDDPNTSAGAEVREFCRFTLEGADDLAYVLPVDPAGSSPVVSGFLDIFARDVAISYSKAGRVDFWTARVDPELPKVGWLSTCTTETGLSEPALVSGSTLKKAALVNATRSQLTIWDVGSSRLEYENDFKDHHTIQDLDWTSTPDSQSILAVGFQYRVVLLSQMRFDYLNKGPAWAQIREISIRELTPHPIGDSTWLGDGHLVIGAGNQMFVQDRQVSVVGSLRADLRLPPRKDGAWDIFDAVQRFNGPLPVFHPQFLSQCILAGKAALVRRTLVALHKTLKYHIQGDIIDDYLGMDLGEYYLPSQSQSQSVERGQGSYLNGSLGDDEDEDIFTEQTALSINEKLTKLGIPQLSGHEQIQLADIIECVSLVEKHRRSMDENGARFMLFFRQHGLRKGRTNEMHLSWREINWAFHSNSQDILVDFVSRQNHGSMLWEHARESGIFMWLSDPAALKIQFETIARNEYAKSEEKNPVDCSLYYLALKKKNVLQGLWRMANWNKEQAATQRLLSNNFETPKWKTTALKNAYALLSKRRFEYAAAFFLLADHLSDAVEVCLRQLKDMQLAIAITRVYEGDNGPVLRKLLQDEVLPLAAHEGNRWLASWAFWMMGRKDMAVRALITPVYTLLETPCSPDIKSRLFLTDDPALVVLYSDLRHQTLQTLRGASKVTPKVEWEFVLHSAKLYDRMGCDLLGLDLVRNWEFQRQTVAGFGGEVNPLKLLRRRSSLVVADLPSHSLPFETRHLNKKAAVVAPPTTFQEPDANSLLDSFGF